MKHSKTVWIILLLVFAAAVLRFIELDRRPMHTDEAVQAAKLGILLEEGTFKYNPAEFHGPTVLYLTTIPARLAGQDTFAELSETMLRSVTAVIGVLVVLLPLFFIDALGRRAALFASLLLAFSPAFVFYSRYYIQEMFFVLVLGIFLGGLWRFLQKPSVLWAACAGAGLGLLGATKETWVFVLLATLVAGLITCLLCRPDIKKYLALRFVISFLLPFVFIWVLFYTSFGTRPQGLYESVHTYWMYLDRGSGAQGHAHPWWYYLDILTWIEFFEKPTWNEDGIIVFAFLALLLTVWKKRKEGLFIFLTLFTFILLALYCALPYKTPWNALGFLFGMTLIGGAAIDWFWRKTGGGKVVLAIILVFCLASPAAQSVLMIVKHDTTPSNPYVYGHTGPDIFPMAQRVYEIADQAPAGRDLYIQVVAPGNDYWPWPWYLREFKNVAYCNQVDMDAPAAPVILAAASMEKDIVERLYFRPPPGRRDLYVPLFSEPVQLRPAVEWRGYIKKDFLDSLNAKEAEPTAMTFREEDNIHQFRHDAMNSMFELFIQHPDRQYAGQAARAAFDEIDRMESLLSRFIPNSDVSRISRLKAGQSASISPETMECLQVAFTAHQMTGGVFDITVGRLVEQWKQGGGEDISLDNVGMQNLEIDPQQLTVTALKDDLSVDLGGIGKGCAVDRAAQVLREWKVTKALIHGGTSSILALDAPDGRPGWKIRLSNPQNPRETIREADWTNKAISCSTLKRGSDMIDPRTGRPVQTKPAAWVLGPSAALCDALSTACMIMSPDAIRRLQSQYPEIDVIFILI